MNQPVDITVNPLPSRTWNWLHMNETPVSGVFAQGSHDVRISCPLSIQTDSSADDFAGLPTGMGEDMDMLERESGVLPQTFRTTKGMTAGAPLFLRFHYTGRAQEMNVVNLDIREESAASVIMDYGSDPGASGSCIVRTKIRAGKNASLCLVQIHRLSRSMHLMNDVGIQCLEGAKVRVIHLILGGGHTFQGLSAALAGRGAGLEHRIGYLVRSGGRLDINDVARHLAPETTSAISALGVLAGDARKLFRGTIDFVNGCAGSKGNETEDVLLLDDEIVNQTIPLILCGEEDVEGNHGATIGELDGELLFYLTSRGISEGEVRRMLAKARLDAVCRQIPDDTFRREISDYLDALQVN